MDLDYGSYEDNAKGTAWFSDFTIESGIKSTETEWNFACFIFKNVNVTLDINGAKQNIRLQMDANDIGIMEENMRRFEDSIRRLSGYEMSAKSEICTIEDPITTLSYDEENGYYVGPKDVEKILGKYKEKVEFDHIFVAVRLGDILKKQEIPVNDWIGLRSNGC